MTGALFASWNADILTVSDHIAIPSFSANQCLIQVKYASINPVDYKFNTASFPIIRWIATNYVCRDFSGIVIATGADVTKFKKGDEVYGVSGKGSFQEYTVAVEDTIAKKPRNLSFKESAGLPIAAISSFQGLTKFQKINKDDRVLIIGASGGCGLFAIQFAKKLGFFVAGVCSKKNSQLIQNLGADLVINYDNKDYLEELKNLPKFDLIFDTVTSPDDQNCEEWALQFLKDNSQYVALNGKIIDWQRKSFKCERRNHHILLASITNKDLDDLANFCEQNNIKTLIDSEYQLTTEDVELAFNKQKSRRTKGKIVVKVAH